MPQPNPDHIALQLAGVFFSQFEYAATTMHPIEIQFEFNCIAIMLDYLESELVNVYIYRRS